MAQSIALKLPPRDPKRELLERLEQAPEEHAAALLDGYELLQQLHEHGVFTLARGVLGATDKVVEAVSAGANSEESIRAMRNAVILVKMLGSIDPEFLKGIAAAAGETFGNIQYVPQKPPGLISLLIGFTGVDHRRGLSVVVRFFKRIGVHLNARSEREASKS